MCSPCGTTGAGRLEQEFTYATVRFGGATSREVVHSSPVSVQYALTDFGRTALAVLDELRRWSELLSAETASQR